MRGLVLSAALAGALLTMATTMAAPPAAAQNAKSRMTDIQQNALTDGCWARYNGNPGKLYPCLDGDAYWQDALIDGCKQRYSGNHDKLRRCVDTSSLHGGYQSGGSYGSASGDAYRRDDDDLFARALEYGCDTRHAGNPHTRDACLEGRHYSRQAHADGCMQLYRFDNYTYDRCLDSYRDGGIAGYRGGNGGSVFGGSGSGTQSLSEIQRNALKDGCWQRYSGNNRKLEPCLRGEAYWRDALRDGCWKRYSGNQGKLDRCLRY